MSTVKLGKPRVRYHRNGCQGAPFHTVSFTEGRGEKKMFLRAVVFEAPGSVAVVNLEDAAARYRGDYYEVALREAITETAHDDATYDRDSFSDARPPVN